jgi:hypothetical protein
MKRLSLMLHIQRLLDGDLPDAGSEGLEDLRAALGDLREGEEEAGDLDDLAPVLDKLDHLEKDLADPGDAGALLNEVDEPMAGFEDLDDGEAVESKSPSENLDELRKLLRSAPRGRRGGRGGGGGLHERTRLQALEPLLQAFTDAQGGRAAAGLKNLQRFLDSRAAAGTFGLRGRSQDPVIARRRRQIREFRTAWKEALGQPASRTGAVEEEAPLEAAGEDGGETSAPERGDGSDES